MVRAKGFRLLAATALVVAISIGGSFAPSIASAFCCPAVVVVKLIPVDPVATPGLRGYAEVDECLGMSFLRIIVKGNVPDGTVYTPAFRSLNPQMGEVFAMARRRGETLWQGISEYGMPSGGLSGMTLSIMDADFQDVLTAQF